MSELQILHVLTARDTLIADECYECTAYGDDYYVNEDGELVSSCKHCPYNKQEETK